MLGSADVSSPVRSMNAFRPGALHHGLTAWHGEFAAHVPSTWVNRGTHTSPPPPVLLTGTTREERGMCLSQRGLLQNAASVAQHSQLQHLPPVEALLHGARGEGVGRLEDYGVRQCPESGSRSPRAAAWQVGLTNSNTKLPHCCVPQRDTVSREGRKASQNLSMWKSRPSLPGKRQKGMGFRMAALTPYLLGLKTQT